MVLYSLKTMVNLAEFLDFDSDGCCVIGEPGTLRTAAILAYRDKRNAPIDTWNVTPSDLLTVRATGGNPNVLYIDGAGEETGTLTVFQKSFFNKILTALDCRNITGSVPDLRERTNGRLLFDKVKMLIIDNADNLKLCLLREALYIGQDLKISIVLVGANHLENVIKRNEDLKPYFYRFYRF